MNLKKTLVGLIYFLLAGTIVYNCVRCSPYKPFRIIEDRVNGKRIVMHDTNNNGVPDMFVYSKYVNDHLGQISLVEEYTHFDVNEDGYPDLIKVGKKIYKINGNGN